MIYIIPLYYFELSNCVVPLINNIKLMIQLVVNSDLFTVLHVNFAFCRFVTKVGPVSSIFYKIVFYSFAND